MPADASPAASSNKKMKTAAILALAIFLSAGAACARTASASLEGIGASTWTSGGVTFEEQKGGVLIKADIKSANPGKHGFHIHENGSCERAGAAAGNHFNPNEVGHGYVVRDGFEKAHAGDLGNFEVSSDGTGKFELFVPGLSLSTGDYNISGRAIILREKPDDMETQPIGNSGARIACGEIS